MDPSMKAYFHRVKRIVRISAIVIMIFLFGIFSSYSSIFLGLALGTLVGLINLLLTAWKMNQIGEVAANAQAHGGRKVVFTGMLTRFAIAILAIMLVYKFPHFFNLISTLIGLFIAHIILIVDEIINQF